jgi:hypothetical protein
MPLRLLVAFAVACASFIQAVRPAVADLSLGTGSILTRAAGDRDPATGAATPLAGAVIRAYADPALTSVAGECTTDTTGSCTIAGLAPGAYVVAPHAPPAGAVFHRVATVSTSLGDTQAYAEPVTVGEGPTVARTFVYRRANPPLPARCGVRLSLLYDLSASISDAEAAAMIAASHDFVDALAGTPSAVGVSSFATASPAAGNTNLGPTAVSTPAGVDAVKQAIAGLTAPSGDAGYTNWDAALRGVVGASDVVVMFTDGNPTVRGVPALYPPVVTGLDQIDAGILSANAVKARGARVLVVGVGSVDELSAENLATLSGPGVGVDYAITSFAGVRTVFRALADALCPRAQPPVVVSAAPTPGAPAPVVPVAPAAAEPEPAPAVVTPRFTG